MNTVQSDIYSLIRKFVERQKLALSIIEDLHPDFLLRDDLLKDGLIDELLDATKTYSHVPQKGYWGENNEWEYFFHGGGCRLIHSMTREPIDWDPPEILRFDKYRFLKWVEWTLSQDKETKSVQYPSSGDALSKNVFQILEQLWQLGLLGSDFEYGNTYLLISMSGHD